MENREYLANANAAAPTRPVAPSGPYPQGGLAPTKPGPYWFHQVGEELRVILTAAGVVPDGTVLTQLAQSLRRIYGGNVTTITAVMSPFHLTEDHAGLIVIDATASHVVINLPAVTDTLALRYTFSRMDATINTVTVQRAGTDVIDGGDASFVVLAGYDYDTIASAGIVAAIGRWLTVNKRPGLPQQTGEVCYFARTVAPLGFLKANGALVSRAAYASLFQVISTIYGAGDGATTFRLPDLRGEFIRGWDDGLGTDMGRVIGSSQQATSISTYSHSDASALGAPDAITTIMVNPDGRGPNVTVLNSEYYMAAASAVNGGPAYSGSQTVRPRNSALLACIKF